MITEKISPFHCYILAFKRAFDFKGRSSRAEYWWFQIINLVLVMAVQGAMMYDIRWIYALIGYTCLIVIPSLSLVGRRLHDVGRSYTEYWMYLVKAFLEMGIITLWMFTMFDIKYVEQNIDIMSLLSNLPVLIFAAYYFGLFIKKGSSEKNKYGDPIK